MGNKSIIKKKVKQDYSIIILQSVSIEDTLTNILSEFQFSYILYFYSLEDLKNSTYSIDKSVLVIFNNEIPEIKKYLYDKSKENYFIEEYSSFQSCLKIDPKSNKFDFFINSSGEIEIKVN